MSDRKKSKKRISIVLESLCPFLTNIMKIKFMNNDHTQVFKLFVGKDNFSFGETLKKFYEKKGNSHERKLSKELMEVVEIKLNKIPSESIIHNWAIVFYVSALEAFLRDFFVNIVNHNEKKKQSILTKLSKKIKLSILDDYKKEKITLGDIVAKDYNFQNLNSIQEAYLLLDIDMFKFMNKNIVHGSSLINRIELIKHMLEKRHKIVHDSYNFNELTLEEMNSYFSVLLGIGFEMTFNYINKNDFSSLTPEPNYGDTMLEDNHLRE